MKSVSLFPGLPNSGNNDYPRMDAVNIINIRLPVFFFMFKLRLSAKDIKNGIIASNFRAFLLFFTILAPDLLVNSLIFKKYILFYRFCQYLS